MIILTETTDTIKAVLSAANTTNAMQCIVSYRDIDTTTYTPGRTASVTNGTTAVTLQGSPASSHQCLIDLVQVFNADTATKTLTISFSDNGTLYTLWTGALQSNECIRYQDGKGWSKSDSSGNPIEVFPVPAEDVQTFTSNGTWTKPTTFTPTVVCVVCVGGGVVGEEALPKLLLQLVLAVVGVAVVPICASISQLLT